VIQKITDYKEQKVISALNLSGHKLDTWNPLYVWDLQRWPTRNFFERKLPEKFSAL